MARWPLSEDVLAVDATPRPVHDSPVLLNQGGKGARCTGFDRAEMSLHFMLRDSVLSLFFINVSGLLDLSRGSHQLDSH